MLEKIAAIKIAAEDCSYVKLPSCAAADSQLWTRKKKKKKLRRGARQNRIFGFGLSLASPSERLRRFAELAELTAEKGATQLPRLRSGRPAQSAVDMYIEVYRCTAEKGLETAPLSGERGGGAVTCDSRLGPRKKGKVC